MAWLQPDNKPLSEPMLLVYWCIYASLSPNELNSPPMQSNFFLLAAGGVWTDGAYEWQMCLYMYMLW